MQSVADLFADRRENFLFLREFTFQEFLPPLELLQENAGAALPGKPQPGSRQIPRRHQPSQSAR